MTRQSLISAAILSALSSQVYAAGFALIENSASGMGNAFAGSAASAEDASTIWFNPAGMTHIQGTQVVGALHLIMPQADFSNDHSTLASGAPLSGHESSGGVNALVPNVYFVTRLNDDWRAGLGINAPFGLETNYDDTWIGRYHAVQSDLKIININPSLAYQIDPHWSVGGGLNVQYADVTLTSAIDTGSLLGAPQQLDGFVEITGDNADDLAYGWNLGVIYETAGGSRIGLSYRSEVDQNLSGSADFSMPAAAAPIVSTGLFVDADVSASVTLPAIASLSTYHKLDEQFAMLIDVTWTQWSHFEELRIQYDSAQPDSVTTENWDDNYRFAVGFNYQHNTRLLLRTGLAIDETPVPDPQHRTPRIPGNTRTWFSLGAGYDIRQDMHIDVGYAHLFVGETTIDNTFEASSAALQHTLNGRYDAAVDIISAQLVWNF